MTDACTYSVLLVFSVLSFTDADAVALPLHSLILLVPHWLSSLMSQVATHLWSHRGLIEVSKSCSELLEVSNHIVSTGCDWQLTRTSGCLRHLLALIGHLIGAMGGNEW